MPKSKKSIAEFLRLVPLLITAIAGLSLSVLAYFEAERFSTSQRKAIFERHADDEIDAITSEITTQLALLRAVRGLFNASNAVDRPEFRDFVTSLAPNHTVQALEWIPRVSRSERAEFERRARLDGFSNFQISERDASGVLAPAGRRSEYYPVFYLEPLEGNEAAVGFDLASNPARARALQIARDSGEMVATPPISLVQETGDQYGFLVFVPVYRKGIAVDDLQGRRRALKGFGLGVFRIKDIVESAVWDHINGEHHIRIHIFDDSAPPARQLLYPKGAEAEIQQRQDWPLQYARLIDVAGRTWSVVVTPKAGSKFMEPSWEPRLLLLGGLLLTAITLLYLVSVKRSESALLRAKTDAEAANEMKSEFLTTMSHELRTPMHGVLGTIGLLQTTELSPTQKDYIGRIQSAGDGLLSLLNSILDLSKLEAGALTIDTSDFRFGPLLDSVTGIMKMRALEKGLTFEVDVAPGLPELLRGDQQRIRQVLFNLVGNAIKFTETGTVSIQVTHRPLGQDEYEIRFTVGDTGIGIDAEHQEAIFEKFTQAESTTTRRFGGTGLGLTICRELVELMGGSTGVRSQPGQGSTFWFNVPCEKGDPSRIEEAPSPCLPAAPGKNATDHPLRVLVAEDNRVSQLIATEILKRAGHHADVVDNGVKAVKAAQEHDYDVILMDINMPELDGLDATREIRQMSGSMSAVPIIAVSADAMAEQRDRYAAAGMDSYVSKPYGHDQLLGLIRQFAGGKAKPTA